MGFGVFSEDTEKFDFGDGYWFARKEFTSGRIGWAVYRYEENVIAVLGAGTAQTLAEAHLAASRVKNHYMTRTP